jgi:hypothetical protein
MKSSVGDRWMNYVITRIHADNTPIWERVFFLLASGKLFLFVLTVFVSDASYTLLYAAVFSFFGGVLTFERRRFITIIRTQSLEIQNLSIQLTEKGAANSENQAR